MHASADRRIATISVLRNPDVRGMRSRVDRFIRLGFGPVGTARYLDVEASIVDRVGLDESQPFKEKHVESIDLAACDNVGGGMTPWGAISVINWGFGVGQALYNATGYLGGTLRNYYGEDTALEAFRGGNLGA